MPRKYSRRRRSRSSKRTTKKKSMRRPKSKKIRGGVTVRAQDLTRLPSDVLGEIREMHPLLTPKLNNITLRHAVKDYLNNDFKIRHYIIYRYGEIGDWDVSNVTNMEGMFGCAYGECVTNSFNQPLNKYAPTTDESTTRCLPPALGRSPSPRSSACSASAVMSG